MAEPSNIPQYPEGETLNSSQLVDDVFSPNAHSTESLTGKCKPGEPAQIDLDEELRALLHAFARAVGRAQDLVQRLDGLTVGSGTAAQLAKRNRALERRVYEQEEQIKRIALLKRFLPPPLADLIIQGSPLDPLKSHRREVTVVFVDLRGFCQFTEMVEPEEVMAVLHKYHGEMGRLIVAHQGTLERFTGDGLMVFFNDLILTTNPAHAAICMAVAMRDRMGQLVLDWGGHDLHIGIGAASGHATIGAVGFEQRWDYAVIGGVTNLAARLSEKAEPGQILVSQRMRNLLKELVEFESLGEVPFKGFAKPIPIFNVVGIRKPDATDSK